MSNVKFGKIVASLRKEQFDLETGQPLSQQQLAEAANLSSRTIGKIERDEQVNLHKDILSCLAAALNLTAAESQEFWRAASSEVESYPNLSPAKALDHICQQCSSIKQPAFLIDPFYDLVAVNQPFLQLYELRLKQLQKDGSASNFLSLLFRPDLSLRSMMGNQWYQIAKMHLGFFRCISLRYRYIPYFDELLKQLRNLPDFRALWYSREQMSDDLYCHIGSHRHTHPVYGSIHYSMIITNTKTAAGPLYLVTLMPCNTDTFNCFTKLFMDGDPTKGGMEQVVKEWPHRELIAE